MEWLLAVERRVPAWATRGAGHLALCTWLLLTGACGPATGGDGEPAPPQVQVETPAGPQGEVVRLDYRLVDSESDPVRIEVGYSEDGTLWVPATPAAGGDGVRGLASSPEGVAHTFVWDAAADLTGSAEVSLRILAFDDEGTSAPAVTDPFRVEISGQGAAPSIRVETPASPARGDVSVRYQVAHPDSALLRLEVEFKGADGSFHPATQGVGGDGIEGLASSPEGLDHLFVWDSAADVPGVAEAVVLRLTVSTEAGLSASAETDPIRIENGLPNDPPVLSVQSPGAVEQGEVAISFDLSDPQADTVDVTAEYSLDGVAWAPASPAAGSPSLIDLQAPPEGRTYTFVWDSMQDVPRNEDAVWIRLTPSDGVDRGEAAVTDPFVLRNAGYAPSGLKINEIDVGDLDAVELRNTGTESVDLVGMTLMWSDTGGESGTFTLASAIVPPGGFVLLKEKTGTDTADTLYLGGNINWSATTGGSAALIDRDGNGLDFVRWGGSSAVPPAWTTWNESSPLAPPTGYATLGRFVEADSHTEADFCAMPPTPLGDNAPCLGAGLDAGLVITEVDPDDPVDAVEILNTGTQPVNLTNWALAWTAADGGSGTVLIPPHELAVGERVVLVDSEATEAVPGQRLLDANLGWYLGQGGALTLLDPAGNGIDFVRWGGIATEPIAPASWSEQAALPAPAVSGISLARTAQESDTDAASDFCLQHRSLGQPGSACLEAGVVSSVVINEIDAGAADAIELLNVSGDPVDLSMWSVAWTDTTYAPGQAVLPVRILAPGARLVIREGQGQSSAEEVYLGSGVNIPWDGGVTGGSLTLFDAYGSGIDFVRWGGSTQVPPAGLGWTETSAAPSPPAGQTLGRSPDGTDSDDASDLCLQAPSLGQVNTACQ